MPSAERGKKIVSILKALKSFDKNIEAFLKVEIGQRSTEKV